MKRLSVLVVAGAVVVGGVFAANNSELEAADHGDAPLALANAQADINDLYAWVNADGLVFAMTVERDRQGAVGDLDPDVEYEFHITALAADQTDPEEFTITCTDMGGTGVSCNLTGAGGVDVTDGALYDAVDAATGGVRAFAGIRDDPFYFNGAGFGATTQAVNMAAPSLEFDDLGCPTLTDGTAEALVQCLSTDCANGPGDAGNGAAQNAFAGENVMAIVVSVDAALLDEMGDANPLIKVWASTTTVADGQIDRMGRAAINTALNDPFNLLATAAHDTAKDDYNALADPSAWAPMFQDAFEQSLAILDSLDSTGSTAD